MKDHRALLVKHRKSYYVWTLFDACLERRERELGPGSLFFLSLSIKWNRWEEAGAV